MAIGVCPFGVTDAPAVAAGLRLHGPANIDIAVGAAAGAVYTTAPRDLLPERDRNPGENSAVLAICKIGECRHVSGRVPDKRARIRHVQDLGAFAIIHIEMDETEVEARFVER